MEYNSRTKTIVPGGARGVELKSEFPLMYVWAEILGSVQEYWSILRVITAWGVRRSHYWEGKLGSQEAIPAQKFF